MKKSIIILSILFLCLSACQKAATPADQHPPVQSEYNHISEYQEGDFLLRVTSNQTEYTPDDEVMIEASLFYVGDKSSVDIYHAMSPFWFDVTENEHHQSIPYAMDQPLIKTNLKKDIPYQQVYRKAGGEIGSESNQQFIRQFLDAPNFPKGNYTIKVTADFYTESKKEKQDYKFSTSINFIVR